MNIFQKLKTKKEFKLVELADILINEIKLTRNDIVIIYSSLNQIELVDSQPEDLIYLFQMIVGTEGAILMPTQMGLANYIRNSELTIDAQNHDSMNNLLKNSIKQTTYPFCDGQNTKLFYAWGKIPFNVLKVNIKPNSEIGEGQNLSELSILNAKIIGIGLANGNITLLGKTDNSKIIFYENSNLRFPDDELRLLVNGGIHFFLADSERVFNKWHLLSGLRSE